MILINEKIDKKNDIQFVSLFYRATSSFWLHSFFAITCKEQGDYIWERNGCVQREKER